MRRLSSSEVRKLTIVDLGLDPGRYAIESNEAIACAIRRAAASVLPGSAASLLRSVVRPMDSLIADVDAFHERAEELLEAVVANGDLTQQRDVSGHAGSLLYASPPSYVRRGGGIAILLGIGGEGGFPLPAVDVAKIEYRGHTRLLRNVDWSNLRSAGLLELAEDYWLKSPPQRSAAEHLARVQTKLESSAPLASTVDGLLVLDSDRPVRFYKGRWAPVVKQTGYFVARRPQMYGADIWCFASLFHGRVDRLIDLPFESTPHRACDIAWHVQMAIDATRGHPQEFTLRTESTGCRIQFFSPLPRWGRRRLSAFGDLIESRKSLFAYEVSTGDVQQEIRYLKDAFWMVETP